jgi:hypothetical protein
VKSPPLHRRRSSDSYNSVTGRAALKRTTRSGQDSKPDNTDAAARTSRCRHSSVDTATDKRPTYRPGPAFTADTDDADCSPLAIECIGASAGRFGLDTVTSRAANAFDGRAAAVSRGEDGAGIQLRRP